MCWAYFAMQHDRGRGAFEVLLSEKHQKIAAKPRVTKSLIITGHFS
jgi:hypothetical protein